MGLGLGINPIATLKFYGGHLNCSTLPAKVLSTSIHCNPCVKFPLLTNWLSQSKFRSLLCLLSTCKHLSPSIPCHPDLIMTECGMLCMLILIMFSRCYTKTSDKLPTEDHKLLPPLIYQCKLTTWIVCIHVSHWMLLLMHQFIWDVDNFLWIDIKVCVLPLS